MSKLFLLVDCNNFYVSCERVFNPKIRNKPVVVLSNNDGCFVARSDEVKNLNIPMGAPFFKYKHEIKKMSCSVYSSNYTLYGDLSNRVMMVLSSFSDKLEIYSIDEAFLVVDKCQNLRDFCTQIKDTVYKKTGIPVSIGIGKTKTLAKLANHVAKYDMRKGRALYDGVFYMDLNNQKLIDNVFFNVKIGEVWGIGRRLSEKLNTSGVYNIQNLIDKSRSLMFKKYGILMLRLINELEGEMFYNLDVNPEDAKSVASTRSFSVPVKSINQVKGAIAMHASSVARKLRKKGLFAGSINVFIATNRFEKGKYFKIFNAKLPINCNYTSVITKEAFKCIDKIYKEGLLYKKVGVIAINLTKTKTENLFSQINYEKNDNIGVVIDKINNKFGRNKIKISSFQMSRKTLMNSDYKSGNYTTDWNSLLMV